MAYQAMDNLMSVFVFEKLPDAVISTLSSPATSGDPVAMDLLLGGRKVLLHGGSRYSVEDSVNGDAYDDEDDYHYDEMVKIERMKKSGKRTFKNSKTSSSYSQLKPGFVGKHGLSIKLKR